MAEEALRLVGAVFMLKTGHVVIGRMCGQVGNVLTMLTSLNPSSTLCKLVVRLRVESNTLELLATLIASETFWMKA